MKNISFNFEINKRPNKKGKYAIILRITEDRKHKRSTTNVEVSRISDWDIKKQVVKNTAEYSAKLNSELHEILEHAQDAYRELKSDGIATCSSVLRKTVAEAQKHPLIDFCQERVAELENARSFGTSKKYGDTVNKIRNYLESRNELDLLVNEVDSIFVDKFKAYLLTLPNHKDPQRQNTLSANTITKHLKVLRALLNTALERNYIKSNPMQGLELKEESNPHRHLTNEELRKLQNAKLEPKSAMDNARNVYLFSIYCAGMRLGDVLQLRWRDITNTNGQMRLSYVMTKTHKIRDFALVEEAQNIVSLYKTEDTKTTDYIFPYLDSTSAYARYKSFVDIQSMPKHLHKALFNAINSKEVYVNKNLKKLADWIGIDPFSFHSARRDFAKMANLSGVNCLDVQDLLGHESLATTERYMRDIDSTAMDHALEQIFSSENRERRARFLVRELISLGFGRRDVKTLFDDVKGVHSKKRNVNETNGNSDAE